MAPAHAWCLQLLLTTNTVDARTQHLSLNVPGVLNFVHGVEDVADLLRVICAKQLLEFLLVEAVVGFVRGERKRRDGNE